MSRTEQAPDASMEEILASIRRIITEDPGEERQRPQATREWSRPVKPRPLSEESFADSIARALAPAAAAATLEPASSKPQLSLAPHAPVTPLHGRLSAAVQAYPAATLDDDIFDLPAARPEFAPLLQDATDETVLALDELAPIDVERESDFEPTLELLPDAASDEVDLNIMVADIVPASVSEPAFEAAPELAAAMSFEALPDEFDDAEPFDLLMPATPEPVVELIAPTTLAASAPPALPAHDWAVMDAVPEVTSETVASVEAANAAPVMVAAETDAAASDDDLWALPGGNAVAPSPVFAEVITDAPPPAAAAESIPGPFDFVPVKPGFETAPLLVSDAPELSVGLVLAESAGSFDAIVSESALPSLMFEVVPAPAPGLLDAVPFLATDRNEALAPVVVEVLVEAGRIEPALPEAMIFSTAALNVEIAAPTDPVDALAEAAAKRIVETPTVQAAAAAMHQAVSAVLDQLPTSSLASLHGSGAGVPAPGAPPSRTMEDTVAELLKPMLRDWLDTNMPRIVEKALRQP